jgi:hypothetical protein
VSSASTPLPRPRAYAKTALWVLMGITTLIVLALVEYPYFGHPNPNRALVLGEKLVFLPTLSAAPSPCSSARSNSPHTCANAICASTASSAKSTSAA